MRTYTLIGAALLAATIALPAAAQTLPTYDVNSACQAAIDGMSVSPSTATWAVNRCMEAEAHKYIVLQYSWHGLPSSLRRTCLNAGSATLGTAGYYDRLVHCLATTPED